MKSYIQVAFNLPTEKFFWYRLSSDFKEKPEIGQRVVVPLGKKEKVGFVVNVSSKKPEGKLKEMIGFFDRFSPFSSSLFQLASWITDYYGCSLGQALHSVFPHPFPYEEKIDFSLSHPQENSTLKKEVYLINPGEQKIELFLSWIRENKKINKQVLILVPEISLTCAFEEKIEKWGVKSVIFHSKLPPRERYRRWLAMKKGEVDVVVGTRSVVFSPLPNIGLTLIDEEQSIDYKQKETPKYGVREVATKRGEIENFPVYLVSGSPSLDSWYKAQKGVYRLFNIPEKEKTSSHLTTDMHRPSSFFIVDVKKEKKKNRIFSSLLQEKIKEALERGFPVLVFVPRRGYANFLLCSDCGEVIRCPNCNISLSFHLKKEMLCHWCGFQKEAPLTCPFCEGISVRKIGWGTQRVELEAKKIFPAAKVERFDLDVFKLSPHLISQRIKNKEVDILVGTQLLIKEEIISMVNVVGVILLDVLLNVPDFRATERTFHLLNKIRHSQKKGSFLIVQTYNPTYYVLNKEGEEFYSEELKIRETLGYPPFQRWIRILFEGRIKNKVKDKCEKIAEELEKKNLDFLGPSSCPFLQIKGQYRYHIILRDDGTKTKFLEESIKKAIPRTMRGSVKLGIDVDPLIIT